jgi:hypothetical protein
VQARSLPESLVGYMVSGYWLGLKLGRFLISTVAARLGATTVGMMYACLVDNTAATTLARLVPAGIGVMNAASEIGGSALLWLAGTIAQDARMTVLLLPFAVALALAQFAVWCPIALRLSL